MIGFWRLWPLYSRLWNEGSESRSTRNLNRIRYATLRRPRSRRNVSVTRPSMWLGIGFKLRSPLSKRERWCRTLQEMWVSLFVKKQDLIKGFVTLPTTTSPRWQRRVLTPVLSSSLGRSHWTRKSRPKQGLLDTVLPRRIKEKTRGEFFPLQNGPTRSGTPDFHRRYSSSVSSRRLWK